MLDEEIFKLSFETTLESGYENTKALIEEIEDKNDKEN